MRCPAAASTSSQPLFAAVAVGLLWAPWFFALFAGAALVAEQVAGNFRHFKATGNVDIVPGQRSVILQYRS